MASFDLTRLLPSRYRDKTLDTLIRNLYNRHLTKTDTLPLYGHVGDSLDLQPGDVALVERDLERQINQLTPIFYAEHGSEKILASWPDLLQKLVLLGVDYSTLDDWFKTNSYNFAPPIDLDKFCNFNQYFWVGQWIKEAPSLPYEELGIPASSYVDAVFQSYLNTDYIPEYYVIKRSGLSGDIPVAPTPDLTSWSDWGLTNLWVHKNDVIEFLNTYGGSVSFNTLVQATRPIIEYFDTIKLNQYQTVLGTPSDSGTFIGQSKNRLAQLPMFDLYTKDGTHYGFTSAIFYYQEGTQYAVDPQILRRVAVDGNNDFVFEHSLFNTAKKQLLFFKNYTTQYGLKTIWTRGPESSIKYSKYDTSGTLINQDKFTNFRNYYWTGVDAPSQPSYNLTGLPEYTVIETGGVSDWSIYNKWVHVSQLKRKDLFKYVQASQPIIEFNVGLETQLLSNKTEINQLPKFQLYRFNDVLDTYEPIISILQPNLNDAYSLNTILSKVDNLPTADTIKTNADILSNCFEYNDSYYIQSLYNGEYVPTKDGTTYGYVARTVNFVGEGNGVISAYTPASVCIPEVLTLTAISPTTFSVVGSVTGSHPIVTANTPYTVSGVSFTLVEGAIPYEIGDKFTVEIKSFVYSRTSVFVNLNGIYRTLTSPSSILSERQSNVIVDADPSLMNGVWQVPPQIEWNVQNETRTAVGQGDLYFHFSSIIQAQPNLIGNSNGDNNWRTLSPKDLGLGGTIKQFDGNTALFVSMLLQRGISPLTLIEYARISYESLFSSIHAFVVDRIPQMLTDGVFVPPASGDTIDSVVIDEFKKYFSNYSLVVSSSESSVDDYVSTPFYDSTSSINNLVVTLPYIGLANKVQPQKIVDLELNIPMIVHHDGHQSAIPTITEQVLKDIVTKKFERSPGQQSSGLVSGVSAPALPYKGQFWFKTSTSQLFFYNVVSDTGEQSETATLNDYSYDRSLDILYQFDGSLWNVVSDKSLPWTVVKLDLIESNLILAIETELFENCPSLTGRINSVEFETPTRFNKFQKEELEKFGVTYGVYDVYSSSYDPLNSFTWNYSSVLIPGASSNHAVWQDIYLDVYGTPRPDLQPWISSGYVTESAFLADAILGGYLPPSTTQFDSTTMWPLVESFVRSKQLLEGRPSNLSVNVATGQLLAPSSSNVESLISTVPSSAAARFQYGDNSPVELFWKKTLNFLYSKQKSYFKINPLKWTQETWGIKYETIGDYTLESYSQNKESAFDFMLHGDSLENSLQLSWFSTTVNSAPTEDITYEVKCVSRIDNLFKVTSTLNTTPVFVNSTYSDAYVTINIANSLRGFFWGETYNVVVSPDLSLEESLSYDSKLKAEGFNQLYVQYSRTFGDDLSISINKSLFSDWKCKLGYRFGGFVNTDSLSIRIQDNVIVDPAVGVYVKENKFYDSAWLNALRVQLVIRGSTERYRGSDIPAIGPNGSPGEDWVFRIDNFNPDRPVISWFTYDESAGYQDFIALDGSTTIYPWKRYTSVNGTVSHNAPFLITGIQNLVTFIYGYSDMRESEGWQFNNQENPVLDDTTGRPVSYQLLIEQFVAQQFGGVEAGSAFLFNPFSRKVWFKTPRGVVADLFDVIGIEQETVPTLLEANRKKIDRSKVRVFREDEITQIVFDSPAYTIHLLVSEYEHVVLFENYSAETLVYDSFLGQRTRDVLLIGERQSEFTGRFDFGGHFLLGDTMKRNIENSVESILGLYDASNNKPSPEQKERARALLGYQSKDYFEQRGTPDQTEFRFWQGLIGNKGTNFSINAFVNSKRFKSAKLDEYWAYKIASYGDSRSTVKTEMKTVPNDCSTELSNYLFLESDELSMLETYLLNGGYDMVSVDELPFDAYSIYTNEQAFGMEYIDPRGCIFVKPDDESRWFRYEDLNTLSYFDADIILEKTMTFAEVGKCYQITDHKGNLIKADCFELVDSMTGGYDMAPFDLLGFDEYLEKGQIVYYEVGDYIVGTNPAEYSEPKFRRVNSSTIEILDENLLGRQFTVRCYGPAVSKYSPNILFNHQSNTTAVDDIIWWDPARGSHHPQAFKEVDYFQLRDPATYNAGALVYRTDNRTSHKPWGQSEVGKIWWNKENLDWQFYSDSKIYPDYHERLARWGALADYSSVEIYEWIKSNLSPTEFEQTIESDGKIALKDTIKRDRTWYQRPVAWKYSANPALADRAFNAYQPDRLQISVNSTGYGVAVLGSGDFRNLNIQKNSKISGVVYNSIAKTDEEISSIFGLAKVISDPGLEVGSASVYTGGALFVPNATVSVSLQLEPQAISFNDDPLGQYILSNQLSGSTRYITLKHVPSGRNQKIQVRDVPLQAGLLDSYKFDELGITINYTATFDTTFGSSSTRIQTIATAIGNTAHSIFVRSKVDIFSSIPFEYDSVSYSLLSGQSDADLFGWISWNDPETLPTDGPRPPNNKYEAIVGEWSNVGNFLVDLAEDISERITLPWVGFENEDLNSFKSSWGPWKLIKDIVVQKQYCLFNTSHSEFFEDNFTINTNLTYKQLLDSTTVFVNNIKLRTNKWSIDYSGALPIISIVPTAVRDGDYIRVQIAKHVITNEELEFDPSVEDPDPTIVEHWAYNYPHTVREVRNPLGGLTTKEYFFWVKDKNLATAGNNMNTKKIADLLKNHDNCYAVPQAFKFYNQLDARPNRYAMLSTKGLGRYVKTEDTYKLRLTKTPSLRNDDKDISLKNIHYEWALLRQYQPTRIPRQLWDLLTNTLTGETAIGEALPFEPLSLYDERNGTTVRYGFSEQQQLLVDPDTAKTTVKYTILNTNVDKYMNGNLVVDYISYSGFDINQLDEYLSTTENIRKFMSDLWRNAKPKQLNEIFFAVLEDAAESNLELTDFFKTSFISLNEIRTISSPGT